MFWDDGGTILCKKKKRKDMRKEKKRKGKGRGTEKVRKRKGRENGKYVKEQEKKRKSKELFLKKWAGIAKVSLGVSQTSALACTQLGEHQLGPEGLSLQSV